MFFAVVRREGRDQWHGIVLIPGRACRRLRQLDPYDRPLKPIGKSAMIAIDLSFIRVGWSAVDVAAVDVRRLEFAL